MANTRSSYYSFKHYFREEQKKKGLHYANSEELDKAAYPVWLDTPPEKRLAIKDLTSGIVTKAELREQGIAKGAERGAIKHFVRSRIPNKGILNEVMNLIDVNYYCVTSAGRYLVGECTVVRFSLREGVLGHYHTHVNPGKIPVGYLSDVKRGCKNFGLVPLDEEGRRDDWSILKDIKSFVHFSSSCILFTMPEKVPAVLDFFREICSHAGEDPTPFLVYKVDYLFYTLHNAIKTGAEDFSRDAAFRELQKKKFMCYPGHRCKHHYDIDKHKCTIGRARSWAFTIMETCCPAVGIVAQRGKHLPLDLEDDLAKLGIFTIERNEERFADSCDTMSKEPSTSLSSDSAANNTASDNIDYKDSRITEELHNLTLNN